MMDQVVHDQRPQDRQLRHGHEDLAVLSEGAHAHALSVAQAAKRLLDDPHAQFVHVQNLTQRFGLGPSFAIEIGQVGFGSGDPRHAGAAVLGVQAGRFDTARSRRAPTC